MKKCLLFFIFLPLFTFSQESVQLKDRKFYLGVVISPDYCFRHMNKGNYSISEKSWNELKTAMDDVFVPKIGGTAGINFGIRLWKKVDFETGIHFSNKGFRTITLPILWVSLTEQEDAK